MKGALSGGYYSGVPQKVFVGTVIDQQEQQDIEFQRPLDQQFQILAHLRQPGFERNMRTDLEFMPFEISS